MCVCFQLVGQPCSQGWSALSSQRTEIDWNVKDLLCLECWTQWEDCLWGMSGRWTNSSDVLYSSLQPDRERALNQITGHIAHKPVFASYSADVASIFHFLVLFCDFSASALLLSLSLLPLKNLCRSSCQGLKICHPWWSLLFSARCWLLAAKQGTCCYCDAKDKKTKKKETWSWECQSCHLHGDSKVFHRDGGSALAQFGRVKSLHYHSWNYLWL